MERGFTAAVASSAAPPPFSSLVCAQELCYSGGANVRLPIQHLPISHPLTTFIAALDLSAIEGSFQAMRICVIRSRRAHPPAPVAF
jgi:hypothetical protein